MRAALKALEGIYRKGLVYKKAGGLLLNLVEAGQAPQSLFDRPDPKDDKLIEAFGAINDRLGGGGSIQLGRAAQAARGRPGGAFRSPCYRTRWANIQRVNT